MKIEDLKVGDKVKFYYPEWCVLDTTIGEGYITNDYHKNIFTINGIAISANLIISKLELISTQYKEIPIEHNKPYNFKLLSCCLCNNKEWNYEYSNRYYCKNCLKNNKRILCFCNNCGKNYYSHEERLEICIDCENRLNKSEKSPTPTTTYHCPICDKQLWGTCGMPIKQIAAEPCQKCLDKEKSAPKSFKFKYTMSGYDLWIPENIRQQMGFRSGKTYTIEIKEKNDI